MLVSVIMPSYNHAMYVEEAAFSVLNQTYKKLEFIIIDDGSSDNSVKLLNSINDPRVKLVVQKNAGAHNAINKGLSIAQGDYFTIINSDDSFDYERIEKCLHYMDKNQLDLVCSWVRIIDKNGMINGIKKGWKNMRPTWSMPTNLNGFWKSNDFMLNLIATNFVSTTSNIFFRRSVYETVGGMRALRFAHDWDFMLRVASKFPCGLLPEALINYRIHGKNTITSNKNWMLFEVLWVLATNISQFEGLYLFSEKSDSDKLLVDQITKMSNSIQFGEHDRVFWMIRTFIESRRKVLGSKADEELLNNESLRQVFIDLISYG